MYHWKLSTPLKLPLQFFAAEEEQEQQETQEQENPGGQDNGLPKTQEELDALIEKRLARERRKMARQQGGQTAPQQTTGESQSGTQAAAAQPPADSAAMDALNRELLIAKAQLDAVREGVNPTAAEDAVMLAVMQAEKAGEADEEGVRDAMKEVLKRHPEWKQKKEASGGFKVGVDAGNPGADGKGRKPGLPKGRVIF